MSKSLGNFFTIRELLTGLAGRGRCACLLRTHYRQPLDWTHEGPRSEAKATLDRWADDLRPRGRRADEALAAGADVHRGAVGRPQHAAGDRRAASSVAKDAKGGSKRTGSVAALRQRSSASTSRAGSRGKSADLLSRSTTPSSQRVKQLSARSSRAQGQELQGEPIASATSSPRWASRSRIPRTPRPARS